MKLSRRIEISVAAALVISFAASVFSFAETTGKIREDVLRLHVIANSDSAIDQNLKLKVRDELLERGSEIFDGSVNVENAVEKLSPKLPELEKIAEETVREYGFAYDVKVVIDVDYFPTKTYDYVTLPAGDYLALKVIIGSGKGHNWWCVMFPPMCLGAADAGEEIDDVLNEKEFKLVTKNPKYEPRFKILEIYESIKYKLARQHG